ncbi:TetR/AcrR family transcriptional regulator [Clostridium sp. C8-1-8]|uniref:TetR/AcrR family transcriptional regulator n=1 Tax=Clostridium sp. C8-1-8 TaxID=2698831 RepID=UPI00136DFD67|nr:TetR/AcrR family transcriptional regulator [Clostridium sp. C8-1-8]
MTYLRIKEAGLKLFSQKGFDGTTIKDIASEAGLKPSSIYSHFSSKEEIFVTVWRECISKAGVGVSSVKEYVAKVEDYDAKDVLHKYYVAIVGYFSKNKQEYMFLRQASFFAKGKENINDVNYSNFMINEASVKFFEKFFDKLKDENRIIEDSNENLFYIYISGILAYLEEKVVYNIPLNDEFVDILWSGFWKSIKK